MLCSGCGKDIPFVGQVCPFCQRDKTKDQGNQTLLVIMLIVGGGIGYLIGGFKGLLWGLGVGMVLGVIISVSNASAATSKAPEVRVVPPEPAPASPAPVDETSAVQKRLTDLEGLRSKGLISDDEFQAKRQKILDDL